MFSSTKASKLFRRLVNAEMRTSRLSSSSTVSRWMLRKLKTDRYGLTLSTKTVFMNKKRSICWNVTKSQQTDNVHIVIPCDSRWWDLNRSPGTWPTDGTAAKIIRLWWPAVMYVFSRWFIEKNRKNGMLSLVLFIYERVSISKK